MVCARSARCNDVGGPASVIYRRGSRSSTSLEALVDSATPLDPSVLAGSLVWAPPNTPGRSLYRGIDATHVTVPPDALPGRPPGLSDAPAFLRAALVRAVENALAGARRVAVMTGGGIDSSVLLALATRWAKRTGGSAFAVSLDFAGGGDDRPHLHALERHLGCEVIRIHPEDAVGRIPLLAQGADAAPIWHPTGLMEIEMLARARANGAERVLCGGGADELFGGSPQALAEIALRGHPIRAVQAAQRLAGFDRPRLPSWSWIARPLIGRMLPARVRGWRERRSASYRPAAWAGPALRAFHDEQRRIASINARRPPRTGGERFAAIRDSPYRMAFASGRQQDERAGDIDIWWPYLDLSLAAAVATLPPDYLLCGDRWRGLLRASIRELVPESLREREDKASFEPALRRFIEAAGGFDSLRPLASMPTLGSLHLVDRQAFGSAFERLVASPEDGEAWASLWPPLAIEAFLRGRAS